MDARWEKFYTDLTRFLKNFGDVLAQIYHDPHESRLQPMNSDTAREVLYSIAKASLGTDASPRDKAPDDYGCAETLSNIIQKALPELKFPTLLSTRAIYEYLERSASFTPVSEPEKGDIIISVTGTGNGRVSNGHCGVVGKTWIMSNDSRTGTWEANFQLPAWKRYYEGRGGMPTLFYRLT